ncbi:MAG: replication initiator protein [Microvirus sp.]|nr:MAG: replication initiator protein [Microvirus sp.]
MCLRSRKNAWAFRLRWELKRSKTAKFLTLTYNPENLPTVPTKTGTRMSLRKRDLFRFINSARKANDRYFTDQGLETPDFKMKYYAVGEYGTKGGRPHYHIILFNMHEKVFDKLPGIWDKGYIHLGNVNGKSINYAAKYLIDIDEKHNKGNVERTFSAMSKGLGDNYLKANKDWHKSDQDTPEDWRLHVINDEGFKSPLPRYYKNKLFDEAEKQVIADMMFEKSNKAHLENQEALEKTYGLLAVGMRTREKKEHKNESIKTKSTKNNTL